MFKKAAKVFQLPTDFFQQKTTCNFCFFSQPLNVWYAVSANFRAGLSAYKASAHLSVVTFTGLSSVWVDTWRQRQRHVHFETQNTPQSHTSGTTCFYCEDITGYFGETNSCTHPHAGICTCIFSSCDINICTNTKKDKGMKETCCLMREANI